MSSPEPDRKTLEELWRARVADAKLRLDFACQFVREVERDFPLGGEPSPDGRFARERALRLENLARNEYGRVLRLYSDLVVAGKVPDENDWLPHQTPDV